MNVDSDVELDNDGSGTITLSIELGAEASAMLRAFGGDITAETIKEQSPELPDTAELTVEDSGTTVKITARDSFNSPDELTALLTSGDDPLFSEFSLAPVGDGWRLEATSAITASATSGLGPDSSPQERLDAYREEFRASCDGEVTETADRFECVLADGGKYSTAKPDTTSGGGGDFLSSLESPEVTFSVTFPGRVGDNNAAKVDGSTATWDISDITTVQATSGPGGGTSVPLAIWVLGALVALGAAGAITALVLSRRTGHTLPTSGRGGPPQLHPHSQLPVEDTAGPDWYPDPSGQGTYRYWDGQRWTEHLR